MLNLDSFPHSLALTYRPNDTYRRCPGELAPSVGTSTKTNTEVGQQWAIRGDI